ncbi:MAG: hypothetical protein QXF12_01790 [Candidatus Aenigmatarchaeota archaeon]
MSYSKYAIEISPELIEDVKTLLLDIEQNKKGTLKQNISYIFGKLYKKHFELLRQNEMTEENSEHFINMLYDININEGRSRFNTELLLAISNAYNKKDITEKDKHILEENLLFDTNNNKLNLAGVNIYNTFLAEKEYKTSTRSISGVDYLNIMIRTRMPQIAVKLLTLPQTHMLIMGKFLEKIVHNNEEYIILSQQGQRYLRTTRKNRKYNVSSFVYYIFRQ